MVPEQTLVDKFLKETVPFKVNLVQKENSRLMRFLAKLLFFNHGFMPNYYTTIGNTVYIPSHAWTEDSLNKVAVIAHECQHIADNKRLGILYPLMYLSPQLLVPLWAALAAVAIALGWSSLVWSIALILMFVCAAPIPSPGRAWIELRGYRISAVAYAAQYGRLDERALKFFIKQFTGPSYYFMYPFRKLIQRKLLEAAAVNATLDEYARNVRTFITAEKNNVRG